jgi:cell division protein FtsL
MIGVGTLFWLLLVSATGFAMFGVKYQVQALEDELARNRRAIMAEEHEIRVLDAEWAYLTRPETLEGMNRQFLSLAPISTKQLHTTVADIPLRPPPPAASLPSVPEEAAVVAAAEIPVPPAAPPSAAEGVPSGIPAPVAAERSPGQSALRVMPALLEKPAGAPQVAKAMAVKGAVKPTTPRRAKSLDDLISQIMASR